MNPAFSDSLKLFEVGDLYLRVLLTSFDAALNLQAAGHCLVMVGATCATVTASSLLVRLNLQTRRRRLVVVYFNATSLDIRFDFHKPFFSYSRLLSEAGADFSNQRLSPRKAGTGGGIHHGCEENPLP